MPLLSLSPCVGGAMTDEEIISRIDSGEDSRTQFKREAVKEAFAAGLPITVLQDGCVVRLREEAR